MKSLVSRHFAAHSCVENGPTSTAHGHEEPLRKREEIKSDKRFV